MKKSELKKLRKSLPAGSVSNIAEITGLSVSMVSSVLNGTRNNDMVLDTALKVVEDYKAKKEELSARVKSI